MASVLYSTYLKHLHELQRYERSITTPPFYLMIIAAFFLHISIGAFINFTHDDALRVPLRNLKLNLGDGENLSDALNDRDKALLNAAKEHREARAKADAEFKRKQEEKARRAKLRAERRAKEAAAAAARQRAEALDSIIKTAPEPEPIIEPENSARTASPAPSKEEVKKLQTRGGTSDEGISPSTLIANAKRAAAGLGGGGEQGNVKPNTIEQRRLQIRYTELISRVLGKNKVMPTEAFEQGITGTVYIRVQVTRDGRFKSGDLRVEKTSGHKILDDAALSAARGSNPLPAVPENYAPSEQKLAFIIPVIFK